MKQRVDGFRVLHADNRIVLALSPLFLFYVIVSRSQHQQRHRRTLKPGDDGREARMRSKNLEFRFRVDDRQNIAERLHQRRQHIVVHFGPCKGTRSVCDKHGMEAVLGARQHLRYHSTLPIFPTIRDLSLCKEAGDTVPLIKYHSGTISNGLESTRIHTSA